MNAVYHSNLGPPPLKFLAVTMASFGNDETGARIFPSVDTLKQLIGCEERAVRAGLQKLRALGVLVVDSRMVETASGLRPAGGRRQPTRYRLDLDVLAALPVHEKRKPCTSVQGLEKAQLAAERVHSIDGNPAPESMKPCTGAPETVHPSAPDLSGNEGILQVVRSPLPGRTEKPNQETPNVNLIVHIVAEVLNELHDLHGVVDETELAEDVKRRCAAARIAYDGAAVRKAIDSARVQLAKNVGQISLRVKPRVRSSWVSVGRIAAGVR